MVDVDPPGRFTGVAQIEPDCAPGPLNVHNQPVDGELDIATFHPDQPGLPFTSAMYGVVWGPHEFENSGTALHEVFHTMGAVQKCAPHRSVDFHCSDEDDLMCYDDDDNTSTYPMNYRCTGSLIKIDCGHDDYFDPVPEAGEYLATNWNVAGESNRFITRTANP